MELEQEKQILEEQIKNVKEPVNHLNTQSSQNGTSTIADDQNNLSKDQRSISTKKQKANETACTSKILPSEFATDDKLENVQIANVQLAPKKSGRYRKQRKVPFTKIYENNVKCQICAQIFLTSATQQKSAQSDSEFFAFYGKRKGTEDHGKQYEYEMCAYYALKLCIDKNVLDFKMTTNNEIFGDFDDIELTVTFIDGSSHTFLMQLKHTQEKKGITSKMLAENKQFNLPKYLKSFKNLTNRKNITCILSTNRKMQAGKDTTFKLDNIEVSVKTYEPKNTNHLLLNTSETGGSCFQFELLPNQEISDDMPEFFHNFCLFTNQCNCKSAEFRIEAMLDQLFGCKIDFINFMKQWWDGNFVLRRHDTIAKLAELALLPFIREIPFKTSEPVSEKSKLLKCAIEKFDVTLIKESDRNTIGQLWADTSLELGTMSKVSLKYGLSTKGLRSNSDLSLVDQTKASWYLNKIPLIVKYEEEGKKRIEGAIKILGTEKKKMKIILLGNKTREDFSEWKVFENLLDLRNEQSYMEIIKTFKVSIQGRPSISLQQLIESDVETGSLLEIKELFEMLTEDFCIGKPEANLPETYISRTISTRFLDTRKILKHYNSSKTDLLILNCDKKLKEAIIFRKFPRTTSSQLRGRHKQEEIDVKIDIKELEDYLLSNTSTESKSIIFSTDKRCGVSDFERICAINSQFNVYLLQIIDENRCMMMLNRGNVSKFNIMTHQPSAIEEAGIYDIFNRPLNVITGKPGIGKSTLITYLSHKCPPDYWCIRINLIGCSNIFKQKFSNEVILKKILGNDEAFLDKIVAKFRNHKKIFLFLDGLDEIESEYIEGVLEFIKYSYLNGINVWISSRESLKDRIAHLSLFAIEIEELTEDEQKDYIHKRLTDDTSKEDHIKYTNDETESITNKIFKSVSIDHNAKRLLGIPLQLYIITEIFRNRRQEDEFMEDFFVLSKMYREFFDGKYKHQHTKAGTLFLQALDPPNLSQYEIPALRACLDSETFNKLRLKKKKLDESQKFLREIKDKGNKLGIISQVVEENQSLQAIFTHQSFAEYFACVWLERTEDKLDLIKDDFFKDKYQNLRLIFDIMAAEDKLLHLAALYKNPDQVSKYIEHTEEKDSQGRNALHLACSYCETVSINTRNEEETALVLLVLRTLLQHCDPLENDELFEWDCIHYALHSRSLLPIEVILEKDQVIHLKDLNEHFENSDILNYSSYFGYPLLLNTLIQTYPEIKSQLNGSLFRKAVRKCTESKKPDLKKKYLETIKILAENGCDVNESEHNGSTALHLACKYGADYNLVKVLLDTGADTSVITNKKETPLHLASMSNNKEIITLLLKNNAEINATDEKNWTPLLYACRYGNFDVVKALLDNQADIDARTDEEASVLHLATFNNANNTKIVEFLLDEKGRSVEELDYDDWTPLHYACAHGNHDVIDTLLKHGANINAVSKKDATVLHLGAMGSNMEVLKFLIQNGGNVNQTNKMNWTPLHYASRWGNCDVINMLLDLGADIDAVTSKKMTVLHLASLSTNTDVIKLLIDRGRDVNAPDIIQATPLHYACREGNYDVVKVLLEHDASVNTVTALHTTVLHAASINNNTKIVKLLIDKEANVNALAVNSVTPLHMACLIGNYEVIQTLLQYGANTSAVTSGEGFRDARVVHFFKNFVLEVGIPVNELTESNKTPLYFACKKKHYDVVEMLLREGVRLDCDSCTILVENFDSILYNGKARAVELVLEQLTNLEVIREATTRLPTGFPIYFAIRDGSLQSDLLLAMARHIENLRTSYGTSKVPDSKLFEYLAEKLKL